MMFRVYECYFFSADRDSLDGEADDVGEDIKVHCGVFYGPGWSGCWWLGQQAASSEAMMGGGLQ